MVSITTQEDIVIGGQAKQVRHSKGCIIVTLFIDYYSMGGSAVCIIQHEEWGWEANSAGGDAKCCIGPWDYCPIGCIMYTAWTNNKEEKVAMSAFTGKCPIAL